MLLLLEEMQSYDAGHLPPKQTFKPVPLKAGEDEDYMLALKQEMRGTMSRLPNNIRPLARKGDNFCLALQAALSKKTDASKEKELENNNVKSDEEKEE
ncbi:unnamed protein product [Coregonus sp. 'balchen']|nr:unnamed protein product [Coregonus sp. 'balchen']